MTGTGEDGGAGNGQGGDMSQRIQVGGAGGVTDPKALLPGRLKTRVVALAFGAQRIGALEMRAFPVNGEPIVIWDRLVFWAWCKILCKRNSTKSRRDAMENA